MGATVSCHPRRVLFYVLLGLLVAAVFYLGVGPGPGWSALPAVVTGAADELDAFILGQIRLPRLVVAAFAGAALALAGAVMQATFRNPLASPDVIGTSAGRLLP